VARGDPSALTLVPVAVLLGLMLLVGLHVPRPIVQLISDATETVLGTGTTLAARQQDMTWLK
jgi:hydrogenase-4 component F